MANQNPKLRATSDAEVARRLWPDGHHWDAERQQYLPGPAPVQPAARPGEGVFFQSAPEPGTAVQATEGGEQPSAGTSSSTSSPATAKSSEPTGTPRRRHARTTASPSRQDRKASSTAPAATTSGPGTDAAD